MARPSPLGRGLGALIPTGPPVADTEQGDGRGSGVPANGRTEAGDPGTHAANGMAVDLREPALPEVPGLRLLEVPVDHIVPNPRQPRTVFDPEALAELASSLSEVGFLQPVVVRRIDDAPEPINDVTPRFELVAGERRWRAAAQAGLAAIPVLVRETADDDLLRDALLENLHRVQLNPLEEAAAYQQLLTDFGCTQEELAGRIGRSRPAVSNSLRLLRLPTAVQRRVAAGVLSAGHARALVTIEDPARADALATRVVAEGLSVRALEEIIALGDGSGGGGGGAEDDDSQPPGGRGRRRQSVSPFQSVADDMSDRLDTRVKVTGGGKGGRGRGKLTIEFGGGDDLERILGALRDPATWQ